MGIGLKIKFVFIIIWTDAKEHWPAEIKTEAKYFLCDMQPFQYQSLNSWKCYCLVTTEGDLLCVAVSWRGEAVTAPVLHVLPRSAHHCRSAQISGYIAYKICSIAMLCAVCSTLITVKSTPDDERKSCNFSEFLFIYFYLFYFIFDKKVRGGRKKVRGGSPCRLDHCLV